MLGPKNTPSWGRSKTVKFDYEFDAFEFINSIDKLRITI